MITQAAHPLVEPLPRLRWPVEVSHVFLSFGFCAAVVLTSLLISDACQHWFVIPVLLCGTLVGMDALNWLRGRVDVFDPVGILGMVGMHIFFLAPLLHVIWDAWMPYITPPDDWRPWIGEMAWLNLAGWGIYLVSRTCLERALPEPRARTLWRIEPGRFIPVLLLILVGSAGLQALVYASFGGIFGYMQAFIEEEELFSGMGWVFMFSEAFSIPAVIGAAYWARRSPNRQTWLVIGLMFAGFFVLKMFFGGLRGLRGHTIYGVFWAAGIIHLTVRPLPKKLIALAGAFLLAFMYLYVFYKSYGPEAVKALDGQTDRAEMLEGVHRSFAGVALGDLGRTDVHAFILYRLSPECLASDYQYAWGRSYLGAASLLIPRSIYPDRPPTVFKDGTDALLGPGVYESDMIARFAYGIVGEAMLNFGPCGIPLAFAALGGVIVFTRRGLRKYRTDDSRRYLVPFVLSLSFMVFIWDSDVIVFYVIKEGFVPAMLVLLGSRKIPLACAQVAEVNG